ncbi:hypothetical protein JSQ81_07985 [Sporosarcina sp. Marseille-Q4063]|uniref:hypothetical protein n=1 Tax=Sporosarcina sp. Marseille-Q4063 TaxID=2810514 RepID=UPI001BAE6008|nr:hypothetical protein [Sporosarcina sp. Marseille-Q4063]QUW23451.1 hypothetical protein JSQ81_07985 [Sporosarcina sp. Marseille-Q4063]
MSTNIISVEFLTGLPLAVVTTLLLFFIMWRIGKKRHWFDERFRTVHGRAMSISWLATTVGILVVWMIIILIEGPGLAFWLITGLWVFHMTTFGIASMIANRKN